MEEFVSVVQCILSSFASIWVCVLVFEPVSCSFADVWAIGTLLMHPVVSLTVCADGAMTDQAFSWACTGKGDWLNVCGFPDSLFPRG